MIKCPTCKVPVKENEKFCPCCGEDLSQLQHSRESSATKSPKAPAVTGNGNVIDGGLTTDCNNSYVDSHEVSNVDSHNVTSTVNNTTTNQHTTNINIQLSDGAALDVLLSAMGSQQTQQSQNQQLKQPQRPQVQSQVESGKSDGYGISPKSVESLIKSNTATESSASIQEHADSSAQSKQDDNSGPNVEQDPIRKYKVLLMVFAVIVFGGVAYSMFSGSKTEEKPGDEPKSIVEEPSTIGTTTAPVQVQNPGKAVSTSAEKKEVPKSSPLEEGEKAYRAGDYATARLAFEEATDEGNAKAAFKLAEMYANAEGVACNLSKAYDYMLKAAKGGHAEAYWPLAEMLRNGEGVGANVKEAVKWYKKVVRSDNAHKKQAAELLEILDPDLQ